MPVRVMQLNEMPKLQKKAVLFTKDSPGTRIVPEVFGASWTSFLQAGLGVIFILDDFAGALGAVKMSDPNSGELTATEIFWFTKQSARGRGLRLLRAFEQWAKRAGCIRLTVAHMADSMPEKVKHVYERRGYSLFETHYAKGI